MSDWETSWQTRTNIIGQNGNDGEHYLVESVARCIAGDHASQPLMGKHVGKLGWHLHIDQAIQVIQIVRNFDNEK